MAVLLDDSGTSFTSAPAPAAAASPSSGSYSSGGGSGPSWAKYSVTQGFGPTDEPLDGPYGGYAHFNKGLDYGMPVGTPVDSPVSGKVIAASEDPNDPTGWGMHVWVQDAEGNIHNFGHLSGVDVEVGDTVQAGQLVGKSGNTGHSTGPHLSYDVWNSSGTYIDPSRFVGAPENARSSPTYGGGGGSVPTSQIDSDYIQTLTDAVASIKAQKPTNGNPDDMDQWLARYAAARGALQDAIDSVNAASGDTWKLNADWATSKFNAALNRANTMLAIDEAGANRANLGVNRQLGGLAEGRARAQFVSDTLQKLAPWATTGGKTAFAPGDLGAGVGEFARMIGMDPRQTLIKYPGTTSIDPESLLRMYDEQLGVTGPLPNIPGMGNIDLPSGSLLDSVGAPPSLLSTGSFAPTPTSAPAGPTSPVISQNPDGTWSFAKRPGGHYETLPNGQQLWVQDYQPPATWTPSTPSTSPGVNPQPTSTPWSITNNPPRTIPR